MSRILQILVREYVENVRTKAFLIGVILTPLLMGLTFVIPVFAKSQKVSQRAIAVVDLTGVLGEEFASRLGALPGTPADPAPTTLYRVESVDVGGGDAAARTERFRGQEDGLRARVTSGGAGGLFAYVVLRPSALTKDDRSPATELVTGNVMDPSVHEAARTTLENIVNERVAKERSVPMDAARLLSKRLHVETSSVLAKGEAGSAAAALTPFVFMFLLIVGIMGISQALITSTLEEKQNRVIEVLLSSVSPFELMAGKILGICGVGLTLMAIWSIGGISALLAQGLGQFVDATQIALFLVYYLLGFFLIASLMVAVGSACNTLKEAQNLLSPLMVILILPMMLWMVIAKEPNGTLATVLSLTPPFTPFLMMMRVASVPPPPAWQVPASIAILVLATWFAVRFAARVFRVGILLYGKPPSLREIFRWMRAGA